MKIHFDNMQMVEQLAHKAHLETLKQLNDVERRAVQVMMKALQKGKDVVEIKGFGSTSFDQLKTKLQSRPGAVLHPRSFGKGLANLLGLRISTEALQKEVKKAEAALVQRQEQLTTIERELRSIDKNILEVTDVVHFKDHFATPLYAMHANFIRSLPEDQKEALPLIEKQRHLVNGFIQMERELKDADTSSKLHILEKEILANLNKLLKCKEPDWKRELGMNRTVWGKTVQQTKNTDMEKRIIADAQAKRKLLQSEALSLWTQQGRARKTEVELLQKQIESERNLMKKEILANDLQREVSYSLGETFKKIWGGIRDHTSDVQQVILQTKKELAALKGKQDPLSKGKRELWKGLQSDLLAIRWKSADSRETALRNIEALEKKSKQAFVEMDRLLMSIAKRRGKVGQLENRRAALIE